MACTAGAYLGGIVRNNVRKVPRSKGKAEFDRVVKRKIEYWCRERKFV
jgi:hypothetical protein